jgi:hypothetical protein
VVNHRGSGGPGTSRSLSLHGEATGAPLEDFDTGLQCSLSGDLGELHFFFTHLVWGLLLFFFVFH